ncbi:MAG: hypothetical protein JST89_15365 [Cyanobacteria bacterium SZAS-4]|nr:hypothetical protein [Cyanobacteria bacterium SZAS-4]
MEEVKQKLDNQLLSAQVKLVIWDLDDTFWRGTLSEEAIVPIKENVELVKTLAGRGIISSVCSKNDPALVEQQLRQLAIWDYFVLPSISFQPKGNAILNIIEALQLRPENVVFIDDNPSVLAEAQFNCPKLVCLSSPTFLVEQVDCAALKGNADPELTRLEQYKVIAKKFESRQSSSISDETFLRQSEIRISIDYDIDASLDRIIELVNRSNQLNYTKIRIETEKEREEFFHDLNAFGFNAGIVRVWDKYGDYGIVGFFMTLATLNRYELKHFVFSCRVMNMGIEQYVYAFLNRPDIRIIEPVANPIETFANIDWITVSMKEEAIGRLRDRKITLIGGCDMLQLSTYCSCQSTEFTNREQHGIMKRLDDPFFILGDAKLFAESELRPHIPAANEEDVLQLRDALSTTDAVIVSFYRMMESNYFKGNDGLTFRIDEDALRALLASDLGIWFVHNFTFVEYSHVHLNNLISMSFDRLASSTKASAKIVVLLEDTRKLDDNPEEYFFKNRYNEFILKECARIEKLHYIDVNSAVDLAHLHDDGFHMNRQGYLQLAQAVMQIIDP